MAEKNACVRKLLSETLAFLNSAVESVLGTRGICGIRDSSPECAVVAFPFLTDSDTRSPFLRGTQSALYGSRQTKKKIFSPVSLQMTSVSLFVALLLQVVSQCRKNSEDALFPS